MTKNDFITKIREYSNELKRTLDDAMKLKKEFQKLGYYTKLSACIYLEGDIMNKIKYVGNLERRVISMSDTDFSALDKESCLNSVEQSVSSLRASYENQYVRRYE